MILEGILCGALCITIDISSYKFSSHDIECLAKNIYYEARNQPLLGKLAVASVTINRLIDERFPNKICDVVQEKNQFSWTSDGKSDVPKEKMAYIEATQIARYILREKKYMDITGGALYYHSTSIKPNKFFKTLNKIGKVGDHLFYKD